ncbi:MAG: zf-HC2 domain-containing protein [Vicinamibacterales bacterium]
MPSPDQRFESRLAASLNHSTASGARECLEAELLAAYADGGLGPSERAACETHLADCGRCREVLLAAVETADIVAPGSAATVTRLPPRVQQPPRRAWRWVPIAAPIGVAAALMMAIWLARPTPPLADGPREAAYRSPADSAPAEPSPESASREQDLAQPARPAPPPQALPESPRADTAAKLAESTRNPQLESRENALAAAPPTTGQGEAFAEVPQEVADRARVAGSAATPAAATAAKDSAGLLSIVSPSGRFSWTASAAGVIRRDGPGEPSLPVVETGDRLTIGLAISDTSAWFGGRAGALWHTSDGRSWQRVPLPTTSDISELIASGNAGLTVVAGGVRLSTADDGASWSLGR